MLRAMSRLRIPHLALVLSLAALGAAGCGSSSNSKTATTPAASTPSTPATSSTGTTSGGFCAQFAQLSHQFATESGKSKTQDVALNQRLLTEYKALKPPPAAEAAYAEFVSAFGKVNDDLKASDRTAFQQDGKAAVAAAQKVSSQANCK